MGLICFLAGHADFKLCAEQNWDSENAGISQYMAPSNEFYNNVLLTRK